MKKLQILRGYNISYSGLLTAYLVHTFCFSFVFHLNAQTPFKLKNLIYADSFQTTLDSSKWFVELMPKPHNTVSVKNGVLVLDVAYGATVWLKISLKNKWLMEFDRTIPFEGGKNDRLSDFNIFWQATDPHTGVLMGRNPVFENYDSLSLYYVGFGGNNNTTTRFRKYLGTGEKTILQEYLDKTHLLEAHKTYHCRLVFKKRKMYFYINDALFFYFKDTHPLKTGYFGFRTTQSRQFIDNFRVYDMK
jgi:Domain of unknown function (DUF6250)